MDFRAALLEQTQLFGEVIRQADPSTPVPTCPDWTLTQLFRHVGRGNRWSAQIITDRLTEPLDPRDVRDGKPPEDPDAAIDWLHGGVQLILDAVDQVGPQKVWTFLGPRPAGWWIRRRLHEMTVHRADADLTVGLDYGLPAELAADGVSEWIELATARGLGLAPGQRLHLHATDQGLGPTGEWLVVNDDEGLGWSHAHAKGDAAVRGSALDLLLAVTRRRTDGVEVLGDSAVWDGWLSSTPF
ncbi:maleylpyruvate isomerase family mycothiol-dependent enzyme [Mycobacterium sp. BMJ-28]